MMPKNTTLKNAFVLIVLTLATSPSNAAKQAQLDCLVKPEMYVELSSPVDTTIKQMIVSIGDEIKRGQALVELENSVQISKVNLAKTQALSWSDIENSRVQLKYAERNKKRITNLYKKNSVSLFEKEKAETEVQLAKIELIKAKEKRKIARLLLDQAKTELSLRTIKSPLDGLVIDIYIKVGESVTAKPIMKLAQIDPLKIELIAPTEYFGLLKKGMSVDIYPERPANKKFKATITVVDQLIDPASGSFTVRMSLPNSNELLVAGVNCIALFDFELPMSSESTLFGINP